MRFTLFVPTLNELDGLKAIMPRVKREWVDQILVVDGGSTDGTVDYVKEQGWDLHVQKERGLHRAYAEAWPLIKGDGVITFSPDGNCIPEAIPELTAKMEEGYDMVVASRYLGSAKSEDDGLVTAFGNWLFTRVLINGLHGGSYTDAFNIYRAYRTKLFYELKLERRESYSVETLWSTVIGVEPLLSTRAVKAGCRLGEIASDEPARIGGEAKLQVVRWGGAYLFQILRELWYDG